MLQFTIILDKPHLDNPHLDKPHLAKSSSFFLFCTFQLKTIIQELLVVADHNPSLFIWNDGPTESILYYLHVEYVYDLLNRVNYTTLELNSTSQLCARLQFNGGYHSGGIKLNINHKYATSKSKH